jgi:osmoprotectant transport system ATP-binding protein
MIVIESLTKRYGSTTAVDAVSMVIERNSITVIVGTSGSGKSTLLRMINRLIEPTSGRVLIEDRDTASEPGHQLRRRIGYVIQGHGLFPHRTVAENIGTVPRLLGWEEDRIRARSAQLLEALQLEPAQYSEKYPYQLSGGQQQRVGVARALAAEPALLLMDEPFGALDPLTRAEMQDMLRDLLNRLKKTVLIVTHDLDEALYLASRIVLLEDGHVVTDVAAEDFLRSEIPAVKAYAEAFRRGEKDRETSR